MHRYLEELRAGARQRFDASVEALGEYATLLYELEHTEQDAQWAADAAAHWWQEKERRGWSRPAQRGPSSRTCRSSEPSSTGSAGPTTTVTSPADVSGTLEAVAPSMLGSGGGFQPGDTVLYLATLVNAIIESWPKSIQPETMESAAE